MKSTTFTEAQIKEFKEKYKEYICESNNVYIDSFFRINDSIVSIYKSGKVVFQGKELDGYNSIDEETIYPFDKTTTIGLDEVGTGDYFGPIVCAGFACNKEDINYLKSIGVNDSKKIGDSKIKEIAEIIIKKYKYVVSILDNKKYNEISSSYNLNEMKARLHNFNAMKLYDKVKADYILLDEFCSKDNYYKYLGFVEHLDNITFMTKAETKSVAVACASIIARYFFLKEIERLEKEYDIVLPLGSSNKVKELLNEYKKSDKSIILNNIAKLNFKD